MRLPRTPSRTTAARWRPRRALTAVAGAFLVAATAASCSSSSGGDTGTGQSGASTQSNAATQPNSGAKPRGTLTVGVTSSTNSSIDPYASSVSQDGYMRRANIYDTMFYYAADGSIQPRLALSATANSDNTVWTVKLRSDVKFQDSTPFTADDVVAIVTHILDPAAKVSFASTLANVKSAEKVDDLTVQFNLKAPSGVFKQTLADRNFIIPKKGMDPKKPIGTGPFTLDAFTAGRETDLKAFDGYWGGAPKVAEVKIISFATSKAVTNAMLAGQLDETSVLDPESINTIKGRSDMKILTSAPVRQIRIGMRSDQAPFNDVRVRQAMRLIIDRKLTLSNAYNGIGTLGNDWELDAQNCNPDVPQRAQDLDKAKQLLTEAGMLNHTFTLTTGANQPGMLREVQILAENAKKIGVKIEIRQITLDALLAKWADWNFFTGYETLTFFRQVNYLANTDWSTNPTHYQDKEFTGLNTQLRQATDPAKQCDIKKQMKQILYDRGSSLYAVATPVLTAYSTKVHDLEADPLHGVPHDFRTVSVS